MINFMLSSNRISSYSNSTSTYEHSFKRRFQSFPIIRAYRVTKSQKANDSIETTTPPNAKKENAHYKRAVGIIMTSFFVEFKNLNSKKS